MQLGNRCLIERLLKKGADPRIVNEDGADAFDVNAILLETITENPNDFTDDTDARLVERQTEQRLELRRAIGKLLEPYEQMTTQG